LAFEATLTETIVLRENVFLRSAKIG
jgi:hypothetical protein